MRAFIALELSEEMKDEIIRIQEELYSLDLFEGKLTERENLHLTLKFLGEISEKEADETKKILKNIEFNNIKVKISNLGVFSENYVRIIWIGIDGKEVFELQSIIDKSLEKLFDCEERFMGHITIARPKFVKDRKKLIEKLSEIKISSEDYSIDKIAFKKSELKKSGPVYREIFSSEKKYINPKKNSYHL